jgi:DNA/RNA-binding domain of Phe-tRNA-synthetase-like protein
MENWPDPVQIEEVAALLRIARITAGPIAAAPSCATLLEEIDRECAKQRARYSERPPGEIEGLAPARGLYRSFGIDPTHTRPSSEALLRRVLLGKPFPRILNAVDLCNLLSLRFLLPLGLYDADRIQGRVTLRRGRAQEFFPGIRKERVSLEGRPVLADSLGPFGNPTSDSLRSSVTPVTRRLWLVIFAPASMATSDLRDHALSACDAMSRHLAGLDAKIETLAEQFP